jgi:hypothetical protein
LRAQDLPEPHDGGAAQITGPDVAAADCDGKVA